MSGKLNYNPKNTSMEYPNKIWPYMVQYLQILGSWNSHCDT